jgi:hypothetical protein
MNAIITKMNNLYHRAYHMVFLRTNIEERKYVTGEFMPLRAPYVTLCNMCQIEADRCIAKAFK